MDWLTQIGMSRDTLILLLPLLIVVVLFLMLVIRKSPLLGMGMLAGAAVLGTWLVKNKKLQSAFEIEKKLAGKNDNLKQFKERQKERYQAVMANREIIAELEKKLKQLQKQPARNKIEIQLLEKEISERKTLLEKLLKEEDDIFSAEPPPPTNAGDNKLDVYDYPEEDGGETVSPKPGKIELNGYRLIEV